MLQGDAGFADRLEPEARVLIETPVQQISELLGDRRRQRLPVGLAGQDAGDGVGNRFRREGLFARQYLVQHAAEGPDVGAAVDPAAPGLLGRHVRRRAQNHSRARRREAQRRRMGTSRTVGVIGEGLGQPEVQDLDLTFRGDLDVGGLEVAVDDAFVVRRLQRLGDLDRDPHRLLHLHGTTQVRPGNQLQHQKVQTFGLFEPVNRGDVGMVERGQHPRFPLEAGQPLGIAGEGLGQHLDRHLASELGVGGAEHFAHAARPQFVQDAVVSQGLGHRRRS